MRNLSDNLKNLLLIFHSQPGQGGEADGPRDLRAELLAAEAAHFAKTKGVTDEARTEPVPKTKRDLEDDAEANLDAEDIEAKRRRILEETRDIDADSIGSESDSSEEERYIHIFTSTLAQGDMLIMYQRRRRRRSRRTHART